MGELSDREPTYNNDDLAIEFVGLDMGASAESSLAKRSRSVQQDERHPALNYLFPRNKHARFAVMTSVLLAGLAILVALSGAFPFLSASLAAFVPGRTSGRSALSLGLQQGGLTCVFRAAWAPDSHRIALLGYNLNCAPDQNQMAQLNIYDARTSQLITQIQPDDAILSAYRTSDPQQRGSPFISYVQMLWSPDGKRLALSFYIYTTTASTTTSSIGMLLVENGKQNIFIAPTPGISSLFTWNLVLGAPVIEFYHFPQNSPLVQYNIAPAPVYRWSSNGLLAPEMQTGNRAGPGRLTSIGNPVGDASFSIWQPGTIIGMPDLEQGAGTINGWQEIYGWQTFFAAWSPDGHYFAVAVLTGGRLNPSGQQVIIDPYLQQIPVLPTRDQALATLLLGRAGGFSLPVTWRPDGHVLAAYERGHVELYDCMTGRKLAVLTPKGSEAQGLAQDEGTMLWSPNGASLLFYSPTWDRVTLWSAGQLPKV